MHGTHALIFGGNIFAPCWLPLLHSHENESTTEIRREPLIRAVLVLDKTGSYKW